MKISFRETRETKKKLCLGAFPIQNSKQIMQNIGDKRDLCEQIDRCLENLFALGCEPFRRAMIIRDVVIYHLDEFIPEEVDFAVK